MAPEHELILRLVGTAARRQADAHRITALARRADAERLVALLEDQRLTALVGSRVLALAPDLELPRLEAIVRERVAADRERSAVFAKVAHSMVARLERAGIRGVPLKGPLLAEELHGDAALRHCCDVDLLVEPDRLEAAAAVIEDAGYQRVEDVDWIGTKPHLHHAFLPRVEWLPPIDLHWRIHWYETAFSDALVRRSRLCPRAGRRPSHPDELASLLLFFERDSFFGLRYAADLAAWWDVHGVAAAPMLLDPVMEAHPEIRQALLTSVAVAERLVGLPGDRLVSARWRHSRRARLAARLANWTRDGDARTVSTTLSMVDCLLAPRGGHREFLRRYSFQPAAVFAEAHRLPPDARVRATLWRIGHGLVRSARMGTAYLRMAWTLRGGRDWVPLPTTESTP